jgi:hypothetical protein
VARQGRKLPELVRDRFQIAVLKKHLCVSPRTKWKIG